MTGATWRSIRAEAAQRLRSAGVSNAENEARFIVEEASGYDASEWMEAAEITSPTRAAARARSLVDRRLAGEPLQYVLGSWSFHDLDLMVDARVLIPRFETETVVDVALEEAVRLGLRRGRRAVAVADPATEATIVDLGTGSGAIALALEAELPDVEVWATDVSEDALTVARANVAGCAAARVRLTAGSWFEALPAALRGRVTLLVSNPPYVSESEVASLPDEVAKFEPYNALVAGLSGREALEHLVATGREWLTTPGALVCELAPHQGEAMLAYAHAHGYRDAVVRNDLSGRPRVLVARTGDAGAADRRGGGAGVDQ
jgi:release factor glutamine methyltransferase